MNYGPGYCTTPASDYFYSLNKSKTYLDYDLVNTQDLLDGTAVVLLGKYLFFVDMLKQ